MPDTQHTPTSSTTSSSSLLRVEGGVQVAFTATSKTLWGGSGAVVGGELAAAGTAVGSLRIGLHVAVACCTQTSVLPQTSQCTRLLLPHPSTPNTSTPDSYHMPSGSSSSS
jgi:hypothetical protein